MKLTVLAIAHPAIGSCCIIIWSGFISDIVPRKRWHAMDARNLVERHRVIGIHVHGLTKREHEEVSLLGELRKSHDIIDLEPREHGDS